MGSKIILGILKYVLYALNTNIPYKWDFCRITLEDNIRLYINVGSYFVAYVAFVFWFTKYVLWELKVLAGDRLGKRHWYSAIGLSLSTATHLLWPAFLMFTYFVSCSFYPWFSAAVVFFLNARPFMPPLIVDGASKTKSTAQAVFVRWKKKTESVVQAAFARWKKETESQLSTDSKDYSSLLDISEESLASGSVNPENIADMEKKETVNSEEQPMERFKSLVLSFIGGGIDKIKSLFQTVFDRLNMFQVQSKTRSDSDTENKDSDIAVKQPTVNTIVSSSFDDKMYLYTIFEKASSFTDASDEFKIKQTDSSGHEIRNTFDLFEDTQRLDKSISEPQQPEEFKDDGNDPQANRVCKSTIW